MSAPTYKLKHNQSDDNHQRNPSWIVAFVRFNTPGSMFTAKEDPFTENPNPLIVINDCTSVSISNSKSSYAKTCTLNMKVGEVWYVNAVSPGDWVFVWMADSEEHIDSINSLLELAMGRSSKKTNSNSKMTLNNWSSGLKFVGRVIGVNAADSISNNGQRSLSQTINCQAFAEMVTSIYYTYIAQSILTADNPNNKILREQSVQTELINLPKSVSNGMGSALTNISEAFDSLYTTGSTQDFSPDAIISFLFILIMGIDNESALVNTTGLKGTFTDAIGIPKSVAKILGKPNANKLWQIYKGYLGLQSYSNVSNAKPWESFSPDFTEDSKKSKDIIFLKTNERCKGFVPPQMPPIWDGGSLWNLMNQYLNPTVNEMYTCLRINRDGQILPTFVVREKPFSTGLFNYLWQKAPNIEVINSDKKTNQAQTDALKNKARQESDSIEKTKTQFKIDKISKENEDKEPKTFYCNIPRWIVTEDLVKSFNVSTDEQDRVNFVQVWGRSKAFDWLSAKMSPELWKQAQFISPNYIADEKDIKRHGLRTDISETEFDVPTAEGGTITHLFARMRGDWLFNGHLKLKGSITMRGIVEPICEGDNLQYRGIVYHIQSVSHQGSISSNGQKTFTTTVSLSNGIKASSLTKATDVPVYQRQDSDVTAYVPNTYNLPGFTDIEKTGRHDRNDDGELISPKKK